MTVKTINPLLLYNSAPFQIIDRYNLESPMIMKM